MPAEAGSAVVREKDKKKKTLWRARRATDHPSLLPRPSLRCFPKGVNVYVQNIGRDTGQKKYKTITRDICGDLVTSKSFPVRRATGLVSKADTNSR